MRHACSVVLVLLACAFAQGCGDDDDTDGPTPSDGGGMDGAIAGGGSGGRSGAGAGGRSGSGGASGSTGSGAAVECGEIECQSPGGPMGFMSACCFDAATSTCGTSAMGGPCSVPAKPDPRCPSVDIGGGVFMLASCCTDMGQCGIDATQFGAGCVELAEAAAGAMMQGGGFMISFPEPRACEEFDGGVDDDAGR